MRITIVQGAFFPVPPLRGGSTERIWFELGKEFARRGHQVTHVSRLFDCLPQRQNVAGVDYLRVAGFDQPQYLPLLKILDLIYSCRVLRVLPMADILVTNTFWLPLLVRSPKFGAIYVQVGRFPRGQMSLYGQAARLQAVSTAVGEAIKSQCPRLQSKVVVIPNPLSGELLDESAELPPFQSRQHSILYVGRIHPEKGIELLLRAFQLLLLRGITKWRLVLVGPWQTNLGGGGEAHYHRLQSISKPMENHVDWVGMVVDPAVLKRYYRSASMFVYPSLADKGETFGLAPLEAMANGCPALVSDLECFRDFISDGRTGFVFNHRGTDAPLALADKIDEIISSSENLGLVASSSFEKATQFSVGRISDRMIHDFESIISGSQQHIPEQT